MKINLQKLAKLAEQPKKEKIESLPIKKQIKEEKCKTKIKKKKVEPTIIPNSGPKIAKNTPQYRQTVYSQILQDSDSYLEYLADYYFRKHLDAPPLHPYSLGYSQAHVLSVDSKFLRLYYFGYYLKERVDGNLREDLEYLEEIRD